MLANYGSVGLFIVVAVLFAVMMPLIPPLLRLINVVPGKPNPVKNSTFECGMQTVGRSWVQFNFRYYFYALMFVALDVMAVFLYPWAVGLRQLGYFGFIAAFIFIFIIAVGYVHAWKKKVLEWK